MDSQQIIKLNLNNGLGEFTRRRNWSSNILDSLRDVVHVMNEDLSLVYCSAASSEFLGYKPAELIGHLFTQYVHVDDIDMFVRELKIAQSKSHTLKCVYRFLRKDGKYTTLETQGRFYKQAFFGSARRIPTEATHSMDSFLDLKMENEMLKRQLSVFKQLKEQQRSVDDSSDDESTTNASYVYTQGVSSSHNVQESVAMLTGLRYDLGERSVGISMGLEDGELTTVAMSALKKKASNQSLRLGKKKRTKEDTEARICTDCGTTEAPEWRRGPQGPKTLCNACGLRWSKTQKKTP